MKLLIIEDSLMVLAALRQSLHPHYVIDVATSGEEGLDVAVSNTYDIILLDLGLPDIPGDQVCTLIRKASVTTPILVLTASLKIRDKVLLLDSGADDYLTKPFSLEELKARIRVLIRRDTPSKTSLIKLGDIVLDPITRRVYKKSFLIELRRKEFDLLEYFMINAGKVLTRPMILDHVWEMNEGIWTNAVDVHIKYLRDKIDRPFGTKMIETVHGVGYRIEGVPKK
ncbi:MAG TPA: response regulator transcription factor [Candidatus Saccharimonadia bacterium]